MIAQRERKHWRPKGQAKMAVWSVEEQRRRVEEAVARRAFKIFENRGSVPGHELEDWRQADAELVSALCCGRMTVDDSMWVGTDIGAFEEGTVEIWLAPRRITICGKQRVDELDARRQHIEPRLRIETVFRVLDLPVEIDPARVTAKFNGPTLEMLLKKAPAKPQQQAQAAAV